MNSFVVASLVFFGLSLVVAVVALSQYNARRRGPHNRPTTLEEGKVKKGGVNRKPAMNTKPGPPSPQGRHYDPLSGRSNPPPPPPSSLPLPQRRF